jgi:hypothetical protein
MKQASRLFPARAEFLWLATDGREGSPPDTGSHPLAWAGYYVMRSGWEPDANYLCFDVGPLGYSHVHQDKLNVVVWGFGRELLFDGGGGQYEKSAWRKYDVDTFAHNTVLVDGLPQRRQTRDRDANVSTRPVEAAWESSEGFDFAAASYADGYGEVDARIATHHRRILFLKPDVFVVADILVPADDREHTYQARWHLKTTSTAFADGTKAVTTTDAGEANLSVVPLFADGLEVRSACAQKEPELLGWFVSRTEGPVPATTVLHTRRGAGTQVLFTLLLPLRPGATNPVASVRCVGDRRVEVAMADGRAFAFHAGGGPSDMIRVSETLADGSAGRQAPNR